MNPTSDPEAPQSSSLQFNLTTQRLIQAVQDLSLARSLDAVMAVVRVAARELTGADGATFVLREGDLCYYAEENAIQPLWKGRRFPMQACISGLAMMNKQPIIIEDIYEDERVPIDAYRPTFVRSMAMVPIRTSEPIGAIGNYWAKRRLPSPDQVKLLQALADSASIALENVGLYADLESRVRERTAQLEAVNLELEAFCRTISHDLRAPLRSITGFSKILEETCGDKFGPDAKECIERICASSSRMDRLIHDLLDLSRVSRKEIVARECSVSDIARDIVRELQKLEPARDVKVAIADDIHVLADDGLLEAALRNLIGNAWKFTSKTPGAVIELALDPDQPETFYIRDNGAGFDMNYAHKLFEPFQRLHRDTEFEGTGIGLATVWRILRRHRGAIRPEGQTDNGATFYVTLPGLKRMPAAGSGGS